MLPFRSPESQHADHANAFMGPDPRMTTGRLAFPTLGSIRSKLRTAYNRLMDSLQRIMEAAASRGLLQESIITTRVLPMSRQ